MEGKQIASQQACYECLNLGFRNTNSWNFFEKCQLFSSISQNFEQLGKHRLLQILIKNMLLMIGEKESWLDVEELFVLANVFLAIIKFKYDN